MAPLCDPAAGLPDQEEPRRVLAGRRRPPPSPPTRHYRLRSNKVTTKGRGIPFTHPQGPKSVCVCVCVRWEGAQGVDFDNAAHWRSNPQRAIGKKERKRHHKANITAGGGGCAPPAGHKEDVAARRWVTRQEITATSCPHIAV